MENKHIVLVHGAGHGAWCWYKVKPLLEAAGHCITALDMAASGINMVAIEEVQTLAEYTKPLLDFLASLPPQERVVLVGHSLGGFNLALAMENFPAKIAVAVFLSAYLPDTDHRPSFIMDKHIETLPKEAWLDTEFSPYNSSLPHLTKISVGPKFLATNLYQLSPIEDLELAKLLVRTTSAFTYDLSRAKNFTSEGYGSVRRVYIKCTKDKSIEMEFQNWMIENYGVDEVFTIQDSDHMPMFSRPQELVDCVSNIAINYA